MSNVKTVYKGMLGAVKIVENEHGDWRELNRMEPDEQTPEQWANEHGLVLSDHYMNVESAHVETLEELIDGSWVTEDNDVLFYRLEDADYMLDSIRDGEYVKVEENDSGQWIKV